MEKSNDMIESILSDYHEETPIDVESHVMKAVEQMDRKADEIQRLRSRVRRGILATMSLVLVFLCSWLYSASVTMSNASPFSLTTDLIAPIVCVLILGFLMSKYQDIQGNRMSSSEQSSAVS